MGTGSGTGTTPDGLAGVLLGIGTTPDGSVGLLVVAILPVRYGPGTVTEDDGFVGSGLDGSVGSGFEGSFGSGSEGSVGSGLDGPVGSGLDGLVGLLNEPDGGVALVDEPDGGRGVKRPVEPVELIMPIVPLGGTAESLGLTVIGNHTVVDPSIELIQDTIGTLELSDGSTELVIVPKGGRGVEPSVEVIVPLGGATESLGVTVIGNHTVVNPSTELIQDTIGISELPEGGADGDVEMLWLTVMGNQTVVDPSMELTQDTIGLFELLNGG